MRESSGGAWLALAASLAIIAYLATWAGTIAIRRFAEQRQLLDIPNERSSHTQPIPRGGGLAIVLVTLILATLARIATDGRDWGAFAVTLAAWGLVAAVSLIDDIRSLPSAIRFAAHALAAALILTILGHWARIVSPVFGELQLGLAGVVVAFVWLTGLTNAYNFMDGIDGIAGSQAVVAGLTWMVAASIAGAPQIATVGLILAAASTGFLMQNWPPARIFMGDVGSAFLGLILASLAVAGAEVDPRLALVGILAVWPFVFDASFTFVRRAMRRENVLAAHRSHLYQRLVILGYSHGRVTLLYACLAALGGVLAIVWMLGTAIAPFLIAILIPAAALGLLYYVEVQERMDPPALSKRQ